MFTGIIQNLAQISSIQSKEGGALRWQVGVADASNYEIGESVSINGCCLTVVSNTNGELGFDLSPETLQRTTAGQRKAKDKVNLERALRVGDLMGGHYVAGHVDGVAKVIARSDQGEGCEIKFELPRELARFVANKGSVSVDGVSLTPFEVDGPRFTVALIPHTLSETTLGALALGSAVNTEVDLLARYVQRLMEEKS